MRCLICYLLCRMSAAALSAAVDTIISQESPLTFRRSHLNRSSPPKCQLLFGRGPGGGASLREAASPGVPSYCNSCRMSAAALSAAVDVIISRKPLLLSGGTPSAATTTPNASRSSGGSAREGLLSEKPPPSHHLAERLNRRLVGQVGGNGFFKPYHVVPRVELVVAGVETTDHGVA